MQNIRAQLWKIFIITEHEWMEEAGTLRTSEGVSHNEYRFIDRLRLFSKVQRLWACYAIYCKILQMFLAPSWAIPTLQANKMMLKLNSNSLQYVNRNISNSFFPLALFRVSHDTSTTSLLHSTMRRIRKTIFPSSFHCSVFFDRRDIAHDWDV